MNQSTNQLSEIRGLLRSLDQRLNNQETFLARVPSTEQLLGLDQRLRALERTAQPPLADQNQALANEAPLDAKPFTLEEIQTLLIKGFFNGMGFAASNFVLA